MTCAGEGPAITWAVYDPRDAWSDGWQLVIDGDSRGLWAPGTVVTANGGPATAVEIVEAGSHKLVVDRHWETLPEGRNPRNFGSNSLTVVVEDGACG
ncbi:MAG: hypothetical protein HKN80_08635 [Acidimicrobiia bacterium]|nr:hypothetical protein [Acidimicrobiia bacterium]